MNVPISIDEDGNIEKFFALSMFFLVLLILLGCEFVFIKDAYGNTLARQNTIFKFYYQAWILCGISSSYAVYWIREKLKNKLKFNWETFFRVFLITTFAFPIFGTTVKCNHFAALKKDASFAKLTLEGIWYMSWRYSGDYKAIQYLKKYASPNQTVLEATGPAFSHYGRISASTGMYTILGWANHENIWRDGSWKLVTQRSNDIRQIYETKSSDTAKSLLDKYQVDYIYIGTLEYEQYKNADFDKFNLFADKVLESEDSNGKMMYLYKYNPDSFIKQEN